MSRTRVSKAGELPAPSLARLVWLLIFSALSYGATGAETSRAIREAGLDPGACYRVRDLSYYKEDIKLYFNEGYLIFSRPVNGERFAAVFIGEVEGGDGELLLLAPTRAERMSLAKFAQAPNLNEHFRNALLLFTDGAAKDLIDRINNEGRGKLVPEMGPALAEQWSPTVANITEGFTIRLLEDVLNPARAGGGFFLAAMAGKQQGSFDLLYDPRYAEEITVGQLGNRGGRLAYDIWTRFPSRSTRAKPRTPWVEATANSYVIEARLAADLRMSAVTKTTITIGRNALRAFPFEVSRAMQVKSVKIDGVPVELVVRESERGRALRPGENDIFLAVSPDLLAAGSQHEIELEHEGNVIATKGRGVYYVGARSNWYPSLGESFATFDLTFSYPKNLTLVTPGEIVDDSTDGDIRTTRRKTPQIRMAGFNLGEYDKVAVNAGGFNVEVYANRALETNLVPTPRLPIMVEPPRPARGGYRPADMVQVIPAPPPPDPQARLKVVAADVGAALQYFSSIFGPPPLKTLTVAPIPDTFGQGFPGLIYLSTLSYLNPEERPASARAPRQQTFFSDLMQAHEVAHQWWGNVVGPDGYQDDWILEALAQYSSLMWIEKKKGIKAVEDVLEDYRNDLLRTGADGRTVDSTGPLTWGYRIDTSENPEAWRMITYEKGAWVMHMLRRRMGDAGFIKMLGELRKRFEFRPVSTRDLQALAKEFLPPKTPGDVIDSFFENWVYSTGIPSIKVKSSQKGVLPAIRVTGTVEQSDVESDFTMEVPVEIQFAKAPSQVLWVRTSSNEPAPFATTLKLPASKIVARDVLADIK